MSSKIVLAASVAFAAAVVAGSAFAADLPTRKGSPMVPPPVFTWTGFYIGANAGTGAGDVSSDHPFFAPAGVGAPEYRTISSKLPFGDLFLGLEAGYNHQLSNGVVIGLETDFQIGALRKHATVDYADMFFGPGAGFFENDLGGRLRFGLNWFGTTRLRLGYAVTPRFLPFITGGLAYAALAGDGGWTTNALGIGTTSVVQGSGTSVRLGWALGAGFEYALSSHLSMKAEYLYTQYGSASYILNTAHNPCCGASGSGPVVSRTVGVHVLRTGLNWKFGAPIMAYNDGGFLGLFGSVPGPRPSWTGLYFGLNGGYGAGVLHSTLTQTQPTAFGSVEVERVRTTLGMGSFEFGGQIGYNLEFANHVVAGLETDLQWGGAKTRGDATFSDITTPLFIQNFAGSVRYGQDWYGSTRLRLGYAMDNGVLTYVTGGLAYTGLSGRINWTTSASGVGPQAIVNGSASGVRLGWTLGAGGEYPINDRLSIKSEFLYTQFSGMPVGGGGTLGPAGAVAGPMVQRLDVRNFGVWHTRIGLNWKLGSVGAAPVVAKY